MVNSSVVRLAVSGVSEHMGRGATRARAVGEGEKYEQIWIQLTTSSANLSYEGTFVLIGEKSLLGLHNVTNDANMAEKINPVQSLPISGLQGIEFSMTEHMAQ